MSEVVERVAAALHEDGRCGDEPTYADDLADTDNHHAQWRVENARRRARVAILALREPTHRMVVAGHGAGVEPGADHDVPMSTFKDIYSAMIDAALSEGTEQ